MESRFDSLSLNTTTPSLSGTVGKATPKHEVADSWDQDSNSEPDTETEHVSRTPKSPPSIPKAPPPTPFHGVSSSSTDSSAWPTPVGSRHQIAGRGVAKAQGVNVEEARRPEKSTAVAGRLIAAGLGMKVPQKIAEQRAYDRSIKEKEIRRRNREKAQREKEEEIAEKAKNAVWAG